MISTAKDGERDTTGGRGWWLSTAKDGERDTTVGRGQWLSTAKDGERDTTASQDCYKALVLAVLNPRDVP